MTTPKPGQKVRGSRSGRPIMALFDLLGRRWTLRILWELREGPLGFNQLQARCESVSPTLLAQRLKELRESGILEDGGLTAEGKSLIDALRPLHRWAANWAKRS
jgi:DNA-binding HxlR family transcriptional regulator